MAVLARSNYIVAVRGDDYSAKSRSLTAEVEWFPEYDHSEAEAQIRGRLYSSHLTDASVDQIVTAAADAFGNRPDLITKWHRDAGGEIHPYRANAGLVECSTGVSDTKIYLPNNASAFLTVHELAHVIDCSKSGQWHQAGRTDGIGTGMYSWDKNKLVAERERLWDLERSGNRPAWLREYSFTNREEFFADASAYFLTSDWHRIQMAIDAPILYDTFRSYYHKPRWAPASEIALINNP